MNYYSQNAIAQREQEKMIGIMGPEVYKDLRKDLWKSSLSRQVPSSLIKQAKMEIELLVAPLKRGKMLNESTIKEFERALLVKQITMMEHATTEAKKAAAKNNFDLYA